MKGSEWIEQVKHLGTDRQALMDAVLQAVAAGHHVPWPMVEVDAGNDVTFLAAMDYFAIGEPTDFVRVPLDGPTAQRVADMLSAGLPTPKMTDDIWKAADVKLNPQPMAPPEYPYNQDMFHVRRIPIHNQWIEDQLLSIAEKIPMGALFAGHKKDVVISNSYVAYPDKLCLYGWHRADGTPIQGPYVKTHHELAYYDYSHGVRLIGKVVKVRGIELPLAEALQDGGAAHALSNEGPLRVLRIPGVPVDDEPYPDTDPSPAIEGGEDFSIRLPQLKRGSRGVAVERWQRIVGCDADGIFGPITEQKTVLFQKTAGLTADGVVDQDDWREGLEAEKAREFQPPPPVPTAADLPDIKFQQARSYTPANRGSKDIWWIVIHDMEAPEHPQTAENVAAWFAGPHHPQASAHYNVDCDSIVQSVHDKDVAWHAKSGNRHGLGIEHAGYHHQSDAEWKDEYSMAMLRLSAALVARLCTKYDIPVEFVDEEGLRAGARGITFHATITKAFKVRGGHIDPGKNFPIDLYLSMVKEAQGAG